jgi:DNA invertase Pin-like site-specific DNA recombinase
MNTDRVDHKWATKAAQYVRMSTDMQKYSIENQIAAIAVYAARHKIEIVRTYLDAGKSGLTIKSRRGLQQLIKDVRSAERGFETILVYDVSRWGRFQDADESAYYEFICREGGVSIRYCAEEFENDGSLGATIIKAIKRTMAAEYSRELSNRVFAGKCRMTMRGFHAGGRAAYGLRRMLIDEHGVMKSLLQQGERKFLHTDRTILVPGPSEEVDVVRSIFDQYVSRNMSIASIVRHLNSRRIPNIDGRAGKKPPSIPYSSTKNISAIAFST